MIYMSSQSTGDGKLTITVTFGIGTDLNVAQMLTQNRVQDALPRLPEDVQRLGVQVRKATPNILLAVHLMSPDSSRDDLYMSNYATLHIKDALARLPGVGDVQLFGARDYAMRIWLDPDKVAAYRLNASEVLAALRAQNLQVSAGVLNQPPVSGDGAYQINVQTLGRLATPEQFADIIVKTDDHGRVTRIRDIGRAEIGAADYGSTAYMDPHDGLVLAVGIVVDDAIVVVENVERNIEAGMLPKEAAHRTMDEVGGALISIALTLCAVFVPSAFLSGITGQFFRQFAVTIAASTVISCIVSLTLSPALCALLLKPHAQRSEPGGFASRLRAAGFSRFNLGFE